MISACSGHFHVLKGERFHKKRKILLRPAKKIFLNLEQPDFRALRRKKNRGEGKLTAIGKKKLNRLRPAPPAAKRQHRAPDDQ